MTVETDIIQPVTNFIRDSKFLLNRCTKPDKKGNVSSVVLISRIHSDCHCFCYWLCGYGFSWLLRKTDPYSYQQYPHRCLSEFTIVGCVFVV